MPQGERADVRNPVSVWPSVGNRFDACLYGRGDLNSPN
jgi:hypothetical protein